MENILLLDTSIASLNKGDDIIMECVRKELDFVLENNFVLTLPTHVSAFHWYQIFRNSIRVNKYRQCNYKFIGGTNLLVKDMLTHYPQWNINLFNYHAIEQSVLVGVGAGSGEKTNFYTRYLYKKILNKSLFHSVRDERSKLFVESLGLHAINTGCVTMWMLTPEFCKTIPIKKSENVVFTLTASYENDFRDQFLIDTLMRNYKNIYYWIQGDDDLRYLNQFQNIENIKLVNPTIEAYASILKDESVEYVGTRLHAGVYAMRHRKRSIIIAIDERAREINKCNNLNCIEKDDLSRLDDIINSEIKTEIKMPFEEINKWKSQFYK